MTDDARGDNLDDLDNALFGGEPSTPPPARDPAPASDIDWFAGIDDARPTPTTGPSAADAAGAAGAVGAAAASSGHMAPSHEPTPDPTTDWLFEPEPEPDIAPAAMGAAPSPSAAEGPIVDAAIFGMASDPPPQPLSRRELHSRPPADRRRRVLTLVLVVALIALVGVGVAAVATGGGEGSVAKSEVKVVGTALPTTTPSTRPTTTAAPATVAPTEAPTTPPATAAPVLNHTPVRTNPPVVATDPPPPPPTDPPTTTTTTTPQPPPTTGCTDPNTCTG